MYAAASAARHRRSAAGPRARSHLHPRPRPRPAPPGGALLFPLPPSSSSSSSLIALACSWYCRSMAVVSTELMVERETLGGRGSCSISSGGGRARGKDHDVKGVEVRLRGRHATFDVGIGALPGIEPKRAPTHQPGGTSAKLCRIVPDQRPKNPENQGRHALEPAELARGKLQVARVRGGTSEIRAPQIGLLGTRAALPKADPRGARAFCAAESPFRSTPPRGAPSRWPQVPPIVRARPCPERR